MKYIFVLIVIENNVILKKNQKDGNGWVNFLFAFKMFELLGLEAHYEFFALLFCKEKVNTTIKK
jgi:hypothetical protein